MTDPRPAYLKIHILKSIGPNDLKFCTVASRTMQPAHSVIFSLNSEMVDLEPLVDLRPNDPSTNCFSDVTALPRKCRNKKIDLFSLRWVAQSAFSHYDAFDISGQRRIRKWARLKIWHAWYPPDGSFKSSLKPERKWLPIGPASWRRSLKCLAL